MSKAKLSSIGLFRQSLARALQLKNFVPIMAVFVFLSTLSTYQINALIDAPSLRLSLFFLVDLTISIFLSFYLTKLAAIATQSTKAMSAKNFVGLPFGKIGRWCLAALLCLVTAIFVSLALFIALAYLGNFSELLVITTLLMVLASLVFLAIRLQFWFLIIIDKDKKIFESLRESWSITNKQELPLIFYWIKTAAIYLAPFLLIAWVQLLSLNILNNVKLAFWLAVYAVLYAFAALVVVINFGYLYRVILKQLDHTLVEVTPIANN